MPNFKKNPNSMKPSGFKMKYQGDNSAFPFKESPTKTRLGRWLMGRKKHVDRDGNVTITDKRGRVVKRKQVDGTKVKYARRNRPMYIENINDRGDLRRGV
jgi:hypothetical protein